MDSKILTILVVLFLIAEVIETVVDVNPKIRKHVQSVPFLNFVYQDAVGYVHIFEKTEMPNKDKLNGAVDNIIQDLQNHGYKVTDVALLVSFTVKPYLKRADSVTRSLTLSAWIEIEVIRWCFTSCLCRTPCDALVGVLVGFFNPGLKY